MALSLRREAARSFFEALEKHLRADEVLADKTCVRLMLDKEAAAQAGLSRKRFDGERAFRQRFLFDRIDQFLEGWLRRREISADPFKVFRYEGPERGPTQHETAIGLSIANIERWHDRLAERVPELADCRSAVAKAKTAAIAPAMRFQYPLPFGAAGECKYGATRKDLERGVYQVAQEVATTGDAARSWTYDAGLLVLHTPGRVREMLGDELWDVWPEVQERIWDAGRVWVILL